MVTLFFVVDIRSWPRFMPRSDGVQRCSAAVPQQQHGEQQQRIRSCSSAAARMRGDYVLAMSSHERRVLHRYGRL